MLVCSAWVIGLGSVLGAEPVAAGTDGSPCPRGLSAELDDLAQLEERFDAATIRESLPSIDGLIQVRTKVKGKKGQVLVTDQGEFAGANPTDDYAKVQNFGGVAELALQWPEWAKARGIKVELSKKSKAYKLYPPGVDGARPAPFVSNVEIRYGDVEEANEYLRETGRRYRYFESGEYADSKQVLAGLADELPGEKPAGFPRVPQARSGSAHFHDVSAHNHDVIPDELWANILNQAKLLKRIDEDAELIRLVKTLPAHLRETVEKAILEAVTLPVEFASAGPVFSLKHGELVLHMPALAQLAQSPREAAMRAAADIKAAAKKVKSGYATLSAVVLRIEKHASESQVPSLLLQDGKKLSDYESVWRAELKSKFGTYVDLDTAVRQAPRR